ncbi:MAG TPA: carbohydrate-binding protein, partial [bacterium]|nr:carbohydrate-binding protein [bacterium]
WLEYTVDAPVPGDYSIDIRVASMSVGGVFHLEFNGVDKTGDVVVPVTGGWQNWTTVSATATLSAGTQLMRFVPTVEGFNINSLDFQTTTWVPDLQLSKPMLNACHPNPFNPTTTISYDLPEPTPVTLAVYDPAGRLVRQLVRGEVSEAGPHSVVWNGRSDAGQVVAAGVYLCRLDAGGYVETRRVVMVK